MKNSQRLRKGDIIKNKDGLYFIITGLYRHFGYVLGMAIINNLPSIYNTRVKTDNFTKIPRICIMLSAKNTYKVIHSSAIKLHMIILPITKQSKKLFEINNLRKHEHIVKFYAQGFYPKYVKVINVQKSLCFENQLFLTYEDI
jgi:hypothetical protein